MRIYIPSCRCLSSACFCFFTDAAEVLAGTLSGRLFLELLGRACWAVPLLAAPLRAVFASLLVTSTSRAVASLVLLRV